MKIKTLALVFAFAIPALASADDKQADKSTPSDKSTTDKSKTDKSAAKLGEAEIKLVAHIHHVNTMVIDLGKLAERSGTAAVKRYGTTVVRDHQTEDKEIIALAKKRGLTKIPADMPETEAEKADLKTQMDAMASLKKIKGTEFDRQYLQLMVDSHDKEIVRNDAAVATVSDSDLKTWLEARHTTLQRHVDAARELQKTSPQASTEPKTAPKP